MKFKSLIGAVALSVIALSAIAQVEVHNAWARATVKGQMATGAFMTLTAKDDARLVGASSPLGIAQIHEMKMEAGVMKMAEIQDGLDLPAGQPVELKPGGYHVMLMDLKAPLAKDSSVPLTLVFKDGKGAKHTMTLKVPVNTLPPGGKPAAMDHSMHGNMPAKP